MRKFTDKRIVPVLMFHSVGLEAFTWTFNYISENVYKFNKKIKMLLQNRFNTIFWEELYKYMKEEVIIPKNSIMLTFDDGYLDNWVYVFPIIKKYGLKITIFVNPEFIDPTKKYRPNLDDVWAKRCTYQELKPVGFLSWRELREMEKSGFVDIQSHSLTHTWYFNGPKIVDFHLHKINSPYPWLFWNERKDRKPFYLNENQENFVKFGYPIFQHEKSILAKRFYPNKNFLQNIVEYASTIKKKDIYKRNNYKSILITYSKKVKEKYDNIGYYEKNEERKIRVFQELNDSKKIIEKKLNKKIDFLCWPGGAYDNMAIDLAREVGYKAWTLSSTDLSEFKNIPGNNPENIKRIGTSNLLNINGKMKRVHFEGLFQIMRIREHQNSFFSKQLLRAIKLITIIK